MSHSMRVGDIIHKEKEAKRKALGQLTNDNCAIGQLAVGYGNTHMDRSQEAITQQARGQLDTPQEDIDRNKSIVLNREIDEYLDTLITSGLIIVTDESDFTAWYARCAHTLGLQRFNRCVIQARKGRQPAKLLSYKLKGAMQLHAKRQLIMQSRLGDNE